MIGLLLREIKKAATRFGFKVLQQDIKKIKGMPCEVTISLYFDSEPLGFFQDGAGI